MGGIPPTGNHINVPVVGIFEFDGGRLLCEKVYLDMATVLTQMGALRAIG
jgi:predicted ester cyclase